MKPLATVRRLARMDAVELRDRLRAQGRLLGQRARFAVRRPAWRRSDVGRLIDPAASGLTREAAASARRGDYLAAQTTLARHFGQRASPWPIGAARRTQFVDRLAARFPRAAMNARDGADLLLQGRYDLLGYRDLHFGDPIDWHLDPVHARKPPSDFSGTLPYLDPAYGDHKIIWELNRHQHWLALGRAWWLTGDTRCAARMRGELRSWIDANPPLAGVNWASMLELAFRSISWLWAIELFANAPAGDENPWLVDLIVALDRQLDQIAHNLSTYFSPNTHLSGEALALYLAGRTLPELSPSARWSALGRDVLLNEIDRQIAADGGHIERSAHYHRYSTDFYLLALLVARATSDPAAPAFEDAVRRQARFLRILADDRGRLPLLGDDDGGQLFRIAGGPCADATSTLWAAALALDEPALAIGAMPEEACWILGHVPALDERPTGVCPSAALLDSGYFVSRSEPGDRLIVDVGPHGFLNAGHAHSDALSLVLTVRHAPVLVDPGTATYTMSAEARDRFRSTRMHNTVLLDGRPHADPAGPFHWSRQPAGRATAAYISPEFDYVEGTHDGSGGPGHVRSVLALHDLGWIVVDHVLVGADAEAWWHLHPRWRVEQIGGRTIALVDREGETDPVALAWSAADLTILPPGDPSGLTSYAPEYGRIEEAITLSARASAAGPFAFATFIARAAPVNGTPPPSIDQVPVSMAPSDDWHGSAWQVTCAGRSLQVLVAVPRPGQSVSHLGVWGTHRALTSARVAVFDLAAEGLPPDPLFAYPPASTLSASHSVNVASHHA